MTSTVATASGDGPARPGAGPSSKRAAQVADQIIGDVLAMGWSVGELLGAEADLIERYRVSRAVFREAVRLVEHQQVARTRRGPGGGLVITEPTVDAVIDAVVLYLYRVEATLDELFEARIVLEEIVSDLAPGRLDEPGRVRLRAFLAEGDPGFDADPRALHALLASITQNPALELFVDVLNRVAMLYSSAWQALGPAVSAQTTHAHARIAEAVIAGDSGLARHRMRRHLEAEGAAAVHELHAAVARAAGNRALELVALVLIRLSRLHQVERPDRRAREQISAEVLRAHEGIAAAVETADPELARHRMRRHLDALAVALR